ncbi:MFS transporter [Edaphobacter paludis]|uniref:MFS transporter n=1 Tax=Edaphobacter paludis TaxID=3035702 RepID=A0AAU7D536_9BACT
MLSFAFAATAINYLNRQTLSVMAPVLLQKFHISATGYSHIVFAFMLAYTFMNGVSGRLLDRLGTRVGYALTIAFWSGAEILSALSMGLLSLGIFQFLLGVGEAGNYPAGVKLITEWFPPEERSQASGIFNSGASIGAILAPPLLAWIMLASGWRTAFVVIGLLGFLWLAGWLAIYREPRVAAGKDYRADRLPLKTVLRSRFLWQFTLSKVFSDPVWYFYIFWFPQYLKVAHSFTLREIGETAWIPFFTATIGNLAGGAVFSVLLRAGAKAATARRIAILIFSILMVGSVFVGQINNAAGCIALISIATFGYSGALANLLAIPGDVFPKGAVASIWGFASMGSGIGGMIFSLATGWLVDHYSYQPVFILFGVIPLLSAWIVWTLPRKAEPAHLLPQTPVG